MTKNCEKQKNPCILRPEERADCTPGCYAAPETLAPDTGTTAVVSPLLFGSNLEHTRSDVFHGIAAELLSNRKFAGKPERYHGCMMQWYPVGEDVFFSEDAPYTRHCEHYHMNRALECHSQNIVNLAEGNPAGIGQHEISLVAEKAYNFRAVIKSASPLKLTVELTSRHGKKVYASHGFMVDAGENWQTCGCMLTPAVEDPDADIRVYFTEAASLSIGALSLMPSDAYRGMRRDVIDCLRKMGTTVLRWPGGNFAGEYCWEDGLMPCDERAPFESYLHLETQPHSMCYDYHEIAIDDFICLCRAIGAEPFVTINPVWNTPEDNARFVEYCNGGPDTEYGKIRAERGFPEPFGVKFWSLGNEMGYGHMEGDKTPAGYTKIAEANAAAMLAVDPTLRLCSSGPYPNTDWAENSANCFDGKVSLVSMHHYSPSPTYRCPEKLGEEYYSSLADIENMRADLRRMHSELSENLQISFDEWNNWYAWYHQTNIYNGIYSALVLHMFMAEAEAANLGMVCHFEAVNEGMIEVFAGCSRLTAAGQIFSAMKNHSGGEIVYLSRFAAVTRREKEYTITLINASLEEEKIFTLPQYASVKNSTLYYGEKMKPVSRFEEKPFALAEKIPGENPTERLLEATVPPHSVLLIKLG